MAVTEFQFRTENPVPAEKLDDLIEAVGWGRRGADAWDRICALSSLLITAWDRERLVGMGRILEDGTMCMVYDVAVHPAYQSRGIGTEIMKRIVGQLKNRPYQSIGLFAWNRNPVNVPFYEKFGFRKINFGMKFEPDS
ncbi:GNAT family N-acetyltransferase [Pelagibius litoralis]|uniref:GNAT family N-acetyltransferase n=1 Tax=Pelagibius litoralis TaxID=374515 RepID=A0A967K7V4_9PROT|nr:GNAT family N-acetyltransferase [Pelagibius litoralis]NIA70063.1 GNAT family N-acetyltransferase [Pelagibius litoralis]